MVLNNFDDVENLSIDPKSLSVEMNTVQHAGSISTALNFRCACGRADRWICHLDETQKGIGG